jgi:uncharacterized protein (DUF2141 family)
MLSKFLRVGLLVALAASLSARAENSGSIVVEITELRSFEGQVLVSIYNDPKGYPRNREAVLQTKVVSPIESGALKVVFDNLEYGDYALAILHDENSSGDMDYAAFGLPAEGYCFSNNVRPRIRAPKFKKAKLELNQDVVTQTIRMLY